MGQLQQLGSWNTGAAIPLSADNYPLWSVTRDLPVSTYVEYKYIKKDGSGNVAWESGSNRAFTTPATGSATRNDSWK